MATTTTAGMEALQRLKSTEPPVWLAPDSSLSKTARTASQHLFSSLKPFATKSPFHQLLIDGFDAEQIWQQIDLQSQPLLSTLRRDIKLFEKNPEEIKKLKQVVDRKKKVLEENNKVINYDDDVDLDMDMDEFDEEEERESEEEEEKEGGIEDKFLKIKELEEYLEDDEAREYGLKKTDDKNANDEEDGESDDDDDDEDDDDEQLGVFRDEGDEDEDANYLDNARCFLKLCVHVRC